ncbi:MAG: ester cyclase [Bryobacteraceae bacterium]
MKSKRLQERSKQPFWRSYRVQGAGAVVLCIGLFFLLIPSHATGGKLEDQNKAAARAAFFDYLNHRDFKRFEEIHTKDFVKHFNNSPAENLSEEMRDAKGQFDSSSDLTFTENWMIAEGDKVAVCFTAKGTHDGVFQGVPATGKRYELSAMTVWRFTGGKIAEEWVFFNDLDLYRKLGLFKDPGSTDH